MMKAVTLLYDGAAKLSRLCERGFSKMAVKNIGIIMNGVTGRMGTNQHLIRSILAIREQGGDTLAGREVIMPDPILVGRKEHKLPRWRRRTAHPLEHGSGQLPRRSA